MAVTNQGAIVASGVTCDGFGNFFFKFATFVGACSIIVIYHESNQTADAFLKYGLHMTKSNRMFNVIYYFIILSLLLCFMMNLLKRNDMH